MHDLVVQSPLPGSLLVNEQLYDLERRFRDNNLTFDDQQIREFQRTNGCVLYKNIAPPNNIECQSRPFNFQPFGTEELFLNWPSGRNNVKKYRVQSTGAIYEVCVPEDHGKWLEEKVSVNRVRFSLQWYDPQLYFTQFAAVARLLRRHLELQLPERKWSNDRLSALIGDANLSLFCKPSFTPQQCLASWLHQMYATVPRGNSELLLLHRHLFQNNATPKAHIVSLLVFMLLERISNGIKVGNDQRQELLVADEFVNNVASRVENAIVNVPLFEKSSAFGYVLHSALESPDTAQKYNARLYMDFLKTKTIDNRFVAAEVLRWNTFYFSGWDNRVLLLPIEFFQHTIDRFYQCLSDHRLVIDADALRRLAALNIKILVEGKTSLKANPCLRYPSAEEYSKLFIIAGEYAKKRAQTLTTQSVVEKSTEQTEEKQTLVSNNSLLLRHAKDVAATDPYVVQKVVFAIRNVILQQKKTTSIDSMQWMNDLYTVLTSTFGKTSPSDIERSWDLLRDLLSKRLPSEKIVTVDRWAPWQKTILRLYNGEEKPFESIDFPVSVMSREQFTTETFSEST